jgi:DNA-binding response OmpR family regulator
MPGSPAPTLSIVGGDEQPSALVIDLPAGTSPAVRHLVERVGATLEELFAAVADETGTERVESECSTPAENTAISLDLRARSAWRNAREIHLTHLEFELLAYFARNPSRAINRNELLDNVWNEPAHFSSRTIDVHIRRLRRKLGPELPLTTVRGFGYRLDGWNASVSSATG